jgi:hypothetical protein
MGTAAALPIAGKHDPWARLPYLNFYSEIEFTSPASEAPSHVRLVGEERRKLMADDSGFGLN